MNRSPKVSSKQASRHLKAGRLYQHRSPYASCHLRILKIFTRRSKYLKIRGRLESPGGKYVETLNFKIRERDFGQWYRVNKNC